MADICEELRKQLHKLDTLRESCVSTLIREGVESDTTKETIRKFDTLAEELRDAAVFYRKPYSERLDGIERKINNDENLNENLTKWECRVLYCVDNEHPRSFNTREGERQFFLEKRRSDIQKKQDLALAFDTIPDRISVTKEEALSGTIRYHYGDLYDDEITSTNGLILPEEIRGSLHFISLTSANNFIFPKRIGTDLILSNLTSAKNVTLPEEVGVTLDLAKLTSSEKLTLPEKVGGNLDLGSLTSANNLALPKKIGGILDVRGLTTIQGITNWPSNDDRFNPVGVCVNKKLPQKEKEGLEKRYPNRVINSY